MATHLAAGCSLGDGTGDDHWCNASPRSSQNRARVAAFSLFASAAILFAFGLPNSPVQAEMPTVSTATELISVDTPVWHEDFDSGWAAARKSGRPMLIFITTESCEFCDAMKRNTLCDAGIRSRIARGFVPIILRPDRNAGALSRIEVKTFPTTLLAHPRGKVIAHRIGYQPPAQLHQLLGQASTTN